MTTYTEITNEIADQWVAALKSAEQFVGVASDGAQRIAKSVPTPSLPAPLKELTDVIVDKLPEPREIVEAHFSFTNRLLSAQRDFTLKLLDASASDTAAATTATKAATGSKKA